MTPRTRILVLAFAALGIATSAWSSYVHYSLLTRPGYTSFCDVSETVSCTQAYLSQYGTLFGVPVALGGLFYFAVVFLLAALGGRRPHAREAVPAYLFALSIPALGFVIYLAWASFFELNTVCPLCATTYVAVIAIFFISGGASSFAMSNLPRRASKDLFALVKSPVALGLALILSVGAVSLIRAFPRETQASAGPAGPEYPPLTDQQRADFIRWYETQPTVNVPIDAGGAKVLIVKFNDFQCPPCRQTYMEYRGILQKYTATGKVKFVLKHFPLESECNGIRDLHVFACEAAAAFVMAQPRGTADKLEEWFFAHQPEISRETIKQAAASVAGVKDFDAQYSRALTLVKTDANLGALLGANSTPTFFINGRRIAGGLPPAAFEAAIQYELSR
jgi:uncharacterized membrane protein